MQEGREEEPWTPDRASYAHTESLSPYGWAWEFVRRNPEFRDEAFTHRARDKATGRPSITPCCSPDGSLWLVARRRVEAAERWGLHCFPNPDRNGLEASPFWTADLIDGELEAFIVPPTGPGYDVLPLSEIPGRKAMLIHMGERVRMLVAGAGYGETLASAAPEAPPTGDVEVALAVGGTRGFDAHIERLGAFIDYCREPARVAERMRESTARRLTDVLMVLDGVLAGRSYREVAHAFYAADEIAEDWRCDGPIKQRIRRIAARGDKLMRCGYRYLLAPQKGAPRVRGGRGVDCISAEIDTPPANAV